MISRHAAFKQQENKNMKNRIMEIQFDRGVLKIGHKDNIGSLNDVMTLGNMYREARGLRPVKLDEWLRLESTHEFFTALERHLFEESQVVDIKGDSNCVVTTDLEVSDIKGKNERLSQVKSPLLISRRGRYGGTWSHKYVMLELAMWLNPDFKIEVISKVFDSGILLERDLGGETFKNVNKLIDEVFPSQDNKDKYIQYAQYVRKVCDYPVEKGTWDKADTETLKLRNEELKRAKAVLGSGLVTDFKQILK